MDALLRQAFMSSTLRVDALGRYAYSLFNTVNSKTLATRLPRPTDGSERKYLTLSESSKPSDLDDFGPRAGDFLLVGTEGYGEHITMVDRFDEGTKLFVCYGGNSKGRRPDGSPGYGVVQQDFPLGLKRGYDKHARRLVRLGYADIGAVMP